MFTFLDVSLVPYELPTQSRFLTRPHAAGFFALSFLPQFKNLDWVTKSFFSLLAQPGSCLAPIFPLPTSSQGPPTTPLSPAVFLWFPLPLVDYSTRSFSDANVFFFICFFPLYCFGPSPHQSHPRLIPRALKLVSSIPQPFVLPRCRDATNFFLRPAKHSRSFCLRTIEFFFLPLFF